MNELLDEDRVFGRKAQTIQFGIVEITQEKQCEDGKFVARGIGEYEDRVKLIWLHPWHEEMLVVADGFEWIKCVGKLI